MDIRKQLGNDSEDFALQYLLERGYRLMQRNFQCKSGEIDLIMQKEDILVFVEVRSRSNEQYGMPAETVNRKKQDKIRKTANYYLYRNRFLEKYYCRFDVISIVWKDGTAQIEWIPDAFQ